MLLSPRSRRCRHRFGTVLVSPARCPCEPRCPRGVKQAVPYGARSDTRPLSASSSAPRSLRSVLSGNLIPGTRLNIYFQAKTAFIPPGHSRLPRKQMRQQLIQASAGRHGARRRIPPLGTSPPVPSAKSGAETPQDVCTSARPTRISAITPSKCRRHRLRAVLNGSKLSLQISKFRFRIFRSHQDSF